MLFYFYWASLRENGTVQMLPRDIKKEALMHPLFVHHYKLLSRPNVRKSSLTEMQH